MRYPKTVSGWTLDSRNLQVVILQASADSFNGIEYLHVSAHHDGEKIWGAKGEPGLPTEDFVKTLNLAKFNRNYTFVDLAMCHAGGCARDIWNATGRGWVKYTKGENANLPGFPGISAPTEFQGYGDDTKTITPWGWELNIIRG